MITSTLILANSTNG